VTDSVFGLINQGGTKVLALDSTGNLGIANGIIVPGVATFRNAVNASGALTAASGSFAGAVTSPTIAKFYANGTPLGSNPHVELITGTASVGTTTVNFSNAFTSPPICTVSVADGTAVHTIAVGTTTATSVQLADGAADVFNLACTGQ
jgi:hypothetical protein